MICWFEAGVTDSFGPQLDGMRDGLGFLPGSACPHYDGEGERRPVYTRLVREGFPSGLAADDCVALRFDGTELAETVTSRDRLARLPRQRGGRGADRAASALARCGATVYFGSRADWKPALKTDQRIATSPARTSAPPAAAARRLLRPGPASNAAPPRVQARATCLYLPDSPVE